MTERPDTPPPLTAEELAVEVDIRSGEGSDGINDIEDFDVARRALFSVVETYVNGDHAAIIETEEQVKTLIVEAAQSFASVLCSEADFEKRIVDAGKSMHSAMNSLSSFVGQFDATMEVAVADSSIYEAGFRKAIATNGYQDSFDKFEQSFATFYLQYLNPLLAEATGQANQAAEVALEKARLRKERLKAASLEVAKAALNAVAIVAVARLWDRRASN